MGNSRKDRFRKASRRAAGGGGKKNDEEVVLRGSVTVDAVYGDVDEGSLRWLLDATLPPGTHEVCVIVRREE